MAEQLFHERGYASVSMRDIADSLTMRQASLYYHVPQGKEQLYVEVTARNLQRHQAGIGKVLTASKDRGVDTRLAAVGDWFRSNTPLRLLSMLETDFSALSEKNARYLRAKFILRCLPPLPASLLRHRNEVKFGPWIRNSWQESFCP